MIPFVPFLGTDIQQGPTYQVGGVTTLMSVGEEVFGVDVDLEKLAIYGGAGYLLGSVLSPKRAIFLAIAALGLSMMK